MSILTNTMINLNIYREEKFKGTASSREHLQQPEYSSGNLLQYQIVTPFSMESQ